MNKVLIIQTAFIGDVILATPLVETIKANYPNCKLDFLVKKGNEDLVNSHPLLSKVYVIDKSRKLNSLFQNIHKIRKEKYDLVINLQRFASSGLIAAFSGGKKIVGFKKNPISFLFNERFEHKIENGQHEVDRNLNLIQSVCKSLIRRPKLYPTNQDFDKVEQYLESPFICLAPASVWKTKQAPIEKWIELIKALSSEFKIYLVGAPSDFNLCQEIIQKSNSSNLVNLCGQLKLMETAALFSKSHRVFVNDSGPLHIASSMNTPVTAFFCSTTPEFGFGPLSDKSEVVEVKNLECRPCGLHGHKTCPKGHFDCGNLLDVKKSNV
ncbi:MAG: glycosyltransferase family 9 protein [Bacteroidetes bacterium]|nr:glycosyltransferase family 9 protein [Bacteroidota bacterium]